MTEDTTAGDLEMDGEVLCWAERIYVFIYGRGERPATRVEASEVVARGKDARKRERDPHSLTSCSRSFRTDRQTDRQTGEGEKEGKRPGLADGEGCMRVRVQMRVALPLGLKGARGKEEVEARPGQVRLGRSSAEVQAAETQTARTDLAEAVSECMQVRARAQHGQKREVRD